MLSLQKTIRIVQGTVTFFLDPNKAARFLVKCKRNGIRKAISSYLKNNNVIYENQFNLKLKSFCILTPRHTLLLARQFEHSLKKVGFRCEIFLDEEKFSEFSSNSIPIVFAPQIFKKLPNKFIAFQLEQKGSHWFSDSYFNLLKKAAFVFEFSQKNLAYLEKNGIEFSKLFYLPITPTNFFTLSYKNSAKRKYDVAFYGCLNQRRKRILAELSKHFSVLIIEDSFGPELYEQLALAKIIVNLHFYEGAQLESTRLVELLSLGFKVISEDSGGPEDEFFNGKIIFTKNGATQELINEIKKSLKIKNKSEQKVLNNDFSWFEFYLFRFLLSQDLINFETFSSYFINIYPRTNLKICLSLPESVRRRESFNSQLAASYFSFFPGLRHSLGWIGCGLSYKFLFLLYKNISSADLLCVCEDDVLFPSNFTSRLNAVENFLSSTQEWEVYCGLISEINKNVVVSRCSTFEKENFLFMNKGVGLVFSFFSQKSLKSLSKWNPSDVNMKKNTIDRYMERNLTQFVTSVPFLVKHNHQLDSTIWGEDTAMVYSSMIQNSEEKLKDLCSHHRSSKMST